VTTVETSSSAVPGRRDAVADSMRIGIIGHVGNENLGDESIIAAVIQNMRCRYPDAEINGFSLNPEDTEARHGIKAFPIRRLVASSQAEVSEAESADADPSGDPSMLHRVKELVKRVPIVSALARRALATLETLPGIANEVPFLLESRRRAKGLDLLIFAGSHQLNDFVGGPWLYPYTVLKWTLLARGAGAKVVFLSLGAGPIDTWLGRLFLRQALKRSSYRSYRDVTAQRAIEGLGLNPAGDVVPDLAFSLDSPVAATGAASAERLIVAINPLPFYTDYWFMTDLEKYETYIGKLATFADWLVDRGCEVRFIPTQLKVDPAVISDVRRRMVRNGSLEHEKLIVEPNIRDLADLLSELEAADIVVATRYHGIVLSLALQKPVLAIAYHDKSRDLMAWLGQGDYVIDGDTFSADALMECFTSLERDRGSVVDSLQAQVPDFKSAVQEQYDAVCLILSGEAGTGR
jgi:polysaccharide pyruvyl transferase WcaK-like protein